MENERPFKICIAPQVLSDLQRRLEGIRWILPAG
jgi:hypothetical protein